MGHCLTGSVTPAIGTEAEGEISLFVNPLRFGSGQINLDKQRAWRSRKKRQVWCGSGPPMNGRAPSTDHSPTPHTRKLGPGLQCRGGRNGLRRGRVAAVGKRNFCSGRSVAVARRPLDGRNSSTSIGDLLCPLHVDTCRPKPMAKSNCRGRQPRPRPTLAGFVLA